MEQNSRTKTEHRCNGPAPYQPDRFDNDPGLEQPTTDAQHDEYSVRLERNWKHAAWRTEMALRLRNPGHRPAGPDGAF